jgi:3-deoxy-D-manno-octulosonic-acid transferase
MAYLFNLVYLLLLIASLPWLAIAAWRRGKYRQGWGAKFLGQVPARQSNEPCIWFHAVSVGEVNLLRPLLDLLARDQPDMEWVLSTTTRTGFELASRQYAGHTVFYCPLDFSWAVRRAMRRIRPRLLVLAELELWPNLIQAARRQGARVAVINGRLSSHSFRGYRRIRWILARSLRQIDLIAAQNSEYAARFQALGACPESVRITGSIKFDGARSDRRNATTVALAQLWNVTDQDRIFLAGSTQAPEEELALKAFICLMEQHPTWRLILAPRHPDRAAEVASLLDRYGVVWQQRSQLEPGDGNPRAKVLLVDVVGELGAWWGLADVGFVGGSLGQRGGQNMIEPAAYGVAVCFGPNTWNFRDVVSLLLSCHGAVVVRDQTELTSFLRRCMEHPDDAQRLGHAAQQLVFQQQGATRHTMELLRRLIHSPAGALPEREKRG